MEATRELCVGVTITMEVPWDNQLGPHVYCILLMLEKASGITSFCPLKLLGDDKNGLCLGLSTPLSTFLRAAKQSNSQIPFLLNININADFLT